MRVLLVGLLASVAWAWSFRCPASTNATALAGFVDFTGKVAVVTGADGHLGMQVGKTILLANGTLILSCRTGASCENAKRSLRMEVPVLGHLDSVVTDLAVFATVRSSAAYINQRYPRVHALINNAGCGTCTNLTVDGFVGNMQVNLFGHALLTELLRPALLAAQGARVVNVASANAYGPFFDAKEQPVPSASPEQLMQWSRDPAKFDWVGWYSVSKFAVTQYTGALGREFPGVTFFSVNPGLSRDDPSAPCPHDVLKFTPCPMTPLQGATSIVFPALQPGLESERVSGALLDFDTWINPRFGEPWWTQDGANCVPRPLPVWLGGSPAQVWTDADRSRLLASVRRLF